MDVIVVVTEALFLFVAVVAIVVCNSLLFAVIHKALITRTLLQSEGRGERNESRSEFGLK